MELESQVCSLELAKKLKELGVKQESLFVWRGIQSWSFGPTEFKPVYTPSIIDDSEFPKEWKRLATGKVTSVCAAFTAAELAEILAFISIRREDYHRIERHKTYDILKIKGAGKNLGGNHKVWSVSFHNDGGYTHPCGEGRDDTLADALALSLINLIKDKLLDNQ